MADVFISYARSTAPRARAAAAALRAEGYQVWIDDDLPTYHNFTAVIREELAAAKSALVLWSADAAASEWVLSEANRARADRKLVQARLDWAELPMPFDQLQCVDLTDWDGEASHAAWPRVLASIDALVKHGPGGRPPGAAQPTTVSPPAGAAVTGAAARPLWRGRRARLAAGAGLALVAIAAAAALLWPSAPATARVSVTALKPLQGGEDARTFGARVTDRMTGMLNETGVQTVPPPGFELPSLRARPPELVLGGSVNQSGGTTTVRLFLQDARSDLTLWTREFAGPTAKQDRLIEQAAAFATETISAALEPQQQKGLDLDPEALALYVQAFDMAKVGAPETEGAILRMYEQAVARAPRFALARGNLALTMAFEAAGSPPAEQAQRYAQVEVEAKRTIAIDPANAGPAYGALGFVESFRRPGDLAARERHTLEGIRAAPQFPFQYMRECQLLSDVGRIAAATESCRRALGMRPMAPNVVGTYAVMLADQGEYAEAEPLLRRMLQLQPGEIVTLFRRFVGMAMTGQFDEADRTLADREDGMGAWPSEVHAALAAWLRAVRTRAPGDGAHAAQALAATVAAQRMPAVAAAQLLALAGQNEAAFELLGQLPSQALFDESGGFLMSATLAPLRGDPRYWALVARSSLPAYWRTTKTWPDFCADATHPIDCPAQLAKAEAAGARPRPPPKGPV